MSANKVVTDDGIKPRHSLSFIDREALTATCAVCGPTTVRRSIRNNKYTSYVCIKGNRQRSLAYRLAHPKVSRLEQRRATSHVLSNIHDEKKIANCSICGPVKIYIRHGWGFDTRVCKNAALERSKRAEQKRRAKNKEFIDNYKLSQGCKNCGYRESANRLQFHAPGQNRKFDRIGKLARLKRESLILELKKYDVLCLNCHDNLHSKPSPKPRRKHKPLPFRSHTM